METTQNQQEVQIGINDLMAKSREVFKTATQNLTSKLNVLIVGKTGVGKKHTYKCCFW